MQETVDIYSKAGVSIFTHNKLLVIGISSCKNHPVSNVLKLKVELSYDLEIPTPGHVSRQNSHSKRYLHHHVHHITIHNSQDMEATYMPTDRWMDTEDAAQMYNGILLSHKREWNNATFSNMNGPDSDYHTKWTQRKTSIVSLICKI